MKEYMIRKSVAWMKEDFKRFRHDSIKFKNAWCLLVETVKEEFRFIFGLK